jgi:hypothetical protein
MSAQEKFQKDGYCLIKNAITPELRDFITQYALFDEMQKFDGVGDSQIPNSYSSYGDPSMETMLMHLLPIMEENTGLKLYPTYSYYRVYRNHSDLKKHTDRPSCEISATLCFNYSYDDTKFNWPIYMDGKEVILSPGDMVIYRGCDLDHWRNELIHDDDNVWHVQGFFHYVNQNGPFSEFKFDKRESIGQKNKNQDQSNQNFSEIIDKPYIQYL